MQDNPKPYSSYRNFGLYPKVQGLLLSPASYEEIKTILHQHPDLIARGNARSYGDSSLNTIMVSTLKLNKILDFDKTQGIITTQSGILLDDLLKSIVPPGFFLPVSPGTKFITIGGALASDIHGKNHASQGVFSDHVLSFKLMNSDGNIIEVNPADELFSQTAGGMGLTGIILEVTFKLKPIETSYLIQQSIQAENLKAVFELFEQNNESPYSVAWIDSMARGKNTGRSVLFLGKHANDNDVKAENKLKIHAGNSSGILSLLSSRLLNSFSIKIYNWLYYNKHVLSKKRLLHYDEFFYPLDKIKNWNLLYGKNGFVQYQFVLPKHKSYKGILQVLEHLHKNKISSFLGVLKVFGNSHTNRFLHFPMPGYTLALDIKIKQGLFKVLNELDEIITNLGGKIYLTKDARMSADIFKKQYPARPDINPQFKSAQSKRLW